MLQIQLRPGRPALKPSDWISIVTIRSDTRCSTSMNGDYEPETGSGR
jgi:hypothetical protein